MALDLPIVGADEDTWGDKNNACLTDLDSRVEGLLTRVVDLEEGVQPTVAGNVYAMPDWDGVGPHPLRPTGLPEGTRVVWSQPFAPLTTPGYALQGDRWEAIDL